MRNIWYGMIDRDKTTTPELFVGIFTFGLSALCVNYFRESTSIPKQEVNISFMNRVIKLIFRISLGITPSTQKQVSNTKFMTSTFGRR